MFKKILVIAAMISISQSVFAVHDSLPVVIPGLADLPPSKTVKIPLTGNNSIPAEEAFSITCDILNPNSKKANPIILKIWVDANSCALPNNSTSTLNDAALNMNQGKLNRPTNTFTASPVYFRASTDKCKMSLNFTNFDNSDTATITNCIATPLF